MFPITHIYIANRIFPDLSDEQQRALSLGAVFCDALSHEITWDRSHSLANEYREEGYFYKGLMTHGANPKGVDYYTDKVYRGKSPGFAFQKSDPILQDVMAATGLDEYHGLWKSHNFIELTFELYIAKTYPETIDLLRSISEYPEEVAHNLRNIAVHLKMSEEELTHRLLGFLRHVDFGDYSEDKVTAWIIDAWGRQLNIKMAYGSTLAIIQKSRKRMEQDVIPFLTEVIELVASSVA